MPAAIIRALAELAEIVGLVSFASSIGTRVQYHRGGVPGRSTRSPSARVGTARGTSEVMSWLAGCPVTNSAPIRMLELCARFS